MAEKLRFEYKTFVGGQTTIGDGRLFFHSANFFRAKEGYFLNHTQLTYQFFKINKVDFWAGYKQEYVDFPFLERWRAEYRPFIQMFYREKGEYIGFWTRSQFEFRFIESELINRYRNQLRFSYERLDILKPYLTTEFSFYFDPLDYTRQRTIVGTIIPTEHFLFNVFVGHQVDKSEIEGWDNRFMTGLGLFYRF